jgi:D-glycero-alpha-D-manno-heptose 1-phosphate guanylyltransferase
LCIETGNRGYKEMEVIVLAGGLGTRLQGVIGAQPKCMAPVNGRPFLAYVFEYLARQECRRVILSLGYKHEVVEEWVAAQELPFVVDTVVEHEPMGTGGGILLAVKQTVADNVAILNGDTMFLTDLKAQMAFHLLRHANLTIGLKTMKEFDRYGVVNTDKENVIMSFEEKKYRDEGTINGGVYILNTKAFLMKHLPAKCSFEKDYMEKYAHEHKFYGFESGGYFIDIGVPEDYALAQEALKQIFE